MPLLTVRLTQEQVTALKGQADGNVSALVREWIAAAPRTSHEACDRVETELRAEVENWRTKYERCRETSLFPDGEDG